MLYFYSFKLEFNKKNTVLRYPHFYCSFCPGARLSFGLLSGLLGRSVGDFSSSHSVSYHSSTINTICSFRGFTPRYPGTCKFLGFKIELFMSSSLVAKNYRSFQRQHQSISFFAFRFSNMRQSFHILVLTLVATTCFYVEGSDILSQKSGKARKLKSEII